MNWTHGYLNAPASAVSGLTQLGARAYDTSIGKFLSVDPVLSPTNPQQNNGYAYSSNNPTTMSDPSGLCPIGANDAGCAPGSKGGGSQNTASVADADDIAAAAATPPPPGGGDESSSDDDGPHRPTTHGGNDSGGTSISSQGKQAYLNRADGSIDDVNWGLVLGAVGIGVLSIAVIACILATVGICSGIGVAAEVAAFGAEGAGIAALDAAAAAEAATAAGEAGVVGAEGTIGEAEITTVTEHLQSIDAFESHAPNVDMVERIQAAISEGRPLEPTESNFMTHELTEADAMSRGMDLDAAHEYALTTHELFTNYHPEVVAKYPELFGTGWQQYWGLK